MKLAALLPVLAFTVCTTAPVFGITVTFTSGCTSLVPGVTTISYTGSTVTDPGGDTTFTTPNFDNGTPPGCTSDFLGESSGQSTTVTFSTPVDYVGFDWGSPDGYNTFQLFDGATQLGTNFTGSIVSGQYANFSADPGEEITSVIFSSGSCCFETTNLSYVEVATSTPEPDTFLGALLAVSVGIVLRKRRAA